MLTSAILVSNGRSGSIMVSKLGKKEGIFLNFVHDSVFISDTAGPVS